MGLQNTCSLLVSGAMASTMVIKVRFLVTFMIEFDFLPIGFIFALFRWGKAVEFKFDMELNSGMERGYRLKNLCLFFQIGEGGFNYDFEY